MAGEFAEDSILLKAEQLCNLEVRHKIKYMHAYNGNLFLSFLCTQIDTDIS